MTELPHPPQPPPPATHPAKVDILILGAGWLYQFLAPLLLSRHITHAATTRDGRNNTIPWMFDPTATDPLPYLALPKATTVLVTFPLLGAEAVGRLRRLYEVAHPDPPHNGGEEGPRWVLLGSTGEWKGKGWFDRHSEIQGEGSERWRAEKGMLAAGGCVLNLAGLMGEPVRDGRIWKFAVKEEAGKEGVRGKMSVHFVSGVDVARGVLAVGCEGEGNWETAREQRWILTDGRVYDWWDLVWRNARGLDSRSHHGGGGEGRHRRWVAELMKEEGVRALPRDGEVLGRRMDSREFWDTFGIVPLAEDFQWAEEQV